MNFESLKVFRRLKTSRSPEVVGMPKDFGQLKGTWTEALKEKFDLSDDVLTGVMPAIFVLAAPYKTKSTT